MKETGIVQTKIINFNGSSDNVFSVGPTRFESVSSFLSPLSVLDVNRERAAPTTATDSHLKARRSFASQFSEKKNQRGGQEGKKVSVSVFLSLCECLSVKEIIGLGTRDRVLENGEGTLRRRKEFWLK